MKNHAFEMSFEGIVTGGIDCRVQYVELNKEIKKSEIIFDLPEWISKQFSRMKKEVEHVDEDERYVSCLIWIGEVENAFAIILINGRKYRANIFHPEYKNEPFEEVRIHDISANLANKAWQLSNLAW